MIRKRVQMIDAICVTTFSRFNPNESSMWVHDIIFFSKSILLTFTSICYLPIPTWYKYLYTMHTYSTYPHSPSTSIIFLSSFFFIPTMSKPWKSASVSGARWFPVFIFNMICAGSPLYSLKASQPYARWGAASSTARRAPAREWIMLLLCSSLPVDAEFCGNGLASNGVGLYHREASGLLWVVWLVRWLGLMLPANLATLATTLVWWWLEVGSLVGSWRWYRGFLYSN